MTNPLSARISSEKYELSAFSMFTFPLVSSSLSKSSRSVSAEVFWSTASSSLIPSTSVSVCSNIKFLSEFGK